MKKLILKYIVCLPAVLALMPSCKKEIGNLNSPTIEVYLNNATRAQLNNLVTGAESGMRTNTGMYLDVVGMIGREMYRFSGAEPRYVQDLLGAGSAVLNNNTFYLVNPWASRYAVVKNCNILIQAANNTTLIDANEKKGYLGFAKTIKAYQLLLDLNLTYTNGMRVQVEDPDNLGPIVNYTDALTTIAGLLDEAKTDFTGATISLQLSSGFTGFKDAAGLIKFNRALAARVAVYRQQWPAALTALSESFYDINAPFNLGVYHVFGSGTGDLLNPAFFPQNQNGEVRLAQPNFVPEATPGDDRINKTTLRTAPATSGGLTSNRDVWVYTSSLAPIPMIRNEELILIYAEANIGVGAAGNLTNAVTAINKIRTSHGIGAYAGAVTVAALTTEMLNQRRYSLFYEGHRWVDMRRYGRLNQLPLDRAGDDVWDKFPLPLTETN
jgi:hypothetical protein